MDIIIMSENLAGHFAKSLPRYEKQEERLAHSGLHNARLTNMKANDMEIEF